MIKEELWSEQAQTKPKGPDTGQKPNEPVAGVAKLERWPISAGQGQMADPILQQTTNSYLGPAPPHTAPSATPAAAEVAQDPASTLVQPEAKVLRLFTVKTGSRGKVQASGSENERVIPVQPGGRGMPAGPHGREDPRDGSSRGAPQVGNGADTLKESGGLKTEKPDEPPCEVGGDEAYEDDEGDEDAETSDPEEVTESEETQLANAEAASLKTFLVS